MLVYCCGFELQYGTKSSDVIDLIADWLSYKSPQQIDSSSLNKPNRIRTGNSTIAVEVSSEEYPALRSIQLTHPDNEVSGRQWTTEVGIVQEAESGTIRCSVLLQTSEISTRVITQPVTTRPYIVHDLIENFGHPARCPGKRDVHTLYAEGAADFAQYLHDPERKNVVVLTSEKPDGTFIVSPDALRFQTEGLAEVYVIPANQNTPSLTYTLGKRYTSWNGAINILFPIINRQEDPFLPNMLLLPEDLESLSQAGHRLEIEVLSLICHRTNLRFAQKHVSPEVVRSHHLARQLSRSRIEAAQTGDLNGMVSALEALSTNQARLLSEYEIEVAKLADKNETLELELMEKEDEIRQLQHDSESIRSAFGQAQLAMSKTGSLSQETCSLIGQAITSPPTPEMSLQIVESLFPDRVIVLDSAYRSATASTVFRYPERAFSLLWTLVTCYWECMAEGKGDVEARKCFGNTDFAAKESETVEKNVVARAKRTFYLNGAPIVMQKHLKHGVKNSPVETIRIHFEWLPEYSKIAIGHCGPHIDFD